LSAAGSLQWYHDKFAHDRSFAELVDEASQVRAGSEGLIFLPYLSGERTPNPDPLARGAWIGLTTRHSQPHLTRAVLEGVAFGLKDIFNLMKDVGLGSVDQIRLSGGGAKSSLWRQILADIFEAELVTVNTTEGAAYGAALLAGVGAGVWPDVDTACAETIFISDRVSPNAETSATYRSAYHEYQNLYPALKPTFHALAKIT